MGGLAATTREAARILDASGRQIIIIETVGVGQSELDIAESADTVLVVLVPESGDSVQIMKAGLMEIADIFVVNKSDRPGADHICDAIRAMQERSAIAASRQALVVQTTASLNKGIVELYKGIGEHRRYLEQNSRLERNRKQRLKNELRLCIETSFAEILWNDFMAENDIDQIVRTIWSQKADIRVTARRLVTKWLTENSLR